MNSDFHTLDATIKPLTLTSVSCSTSEWPDQQPHFLLLYSETAAALKHPMLQSLQVEPARFMYTCMMLSFSALPKRVRRNRAIPRSGYVSIDCGISSNTSYTDETTNIPYVSDEEFIDTGTDHTIASNYADSSPEKQLQTLRSFPNGSRNCYELTVTPEQKYLVRASFMYGSYDGLNGASPSNPLLFDLHLGVNVWTTVNITKASDVHRAEAIFVASAASASVCLVKTGSATPFISALELRPLKNAIYSYANATQNLVLFIRINLAPTGNNLLRYPFDRYDRIWQPNVDPVGWTSISTNLTVKNYGKDQFEAPSAVMQTAAVPVNSSTLEFYWDFVGSGAAVNEFYANLHFSELLPNTRRAFDVYLNGEKWYANYTPPYLMSDAIYSTTPLTPSLRYNWALNSTGLSTLPPILNAIEVYTRMFLKNTPTDSDDGTLGYFLVPFS
ncbi:hypothetical protein B296_00041401 [Ensete ventricosum]|uniref:Malectin-like domain-containing protein n=1 Tax=Ensete ventricosum TaxID=4639 RepID=A0A426XPH7_ENSVE|nr:hypothetical protein B296_00041401 [Ensete ventricosum]